jgi:hypothetical protein
MRLPVVKKVVQFIDENDANQVEQAVELLTEMAEARGITEEEMMVIGELLSNMFGGLEVAQAVKEGANPKQALNDFMKRVMGSIDKASDSDN